MSGCQSFTMPSTLGMPLFNTKESRKERPTMSSMWVGHHLFLAHNSGLGIMTCAVDRMLKKNKKTAVAEPIIQGRALERGSAQGYSLNG